jgi:hypothetical protein
VNQLRQLMLEELRPRAHRKRQRLTSNDPIETAPEQYTAPYAPHRPGQSR